MGPRDRGTGAREDLGIRPRLATRDPGPVTFTRHSAFIRGCRDRIADRCPSDVTEGASQRVHRGAITAQNRHRGKKAFWETREGSCTCHVPAAEGSKARSTRSTSGRFSSRHLRCGGPSLGEKSLLDNARIRSCKQRTCSIMAPCRGGDGKEIFCRGQILWASSSYYSFRTGVFS